jgi:PRTRC genetic system ThiF family protein
MKRKVHIDLAFHQALPVMLYQARKKHVYIVGLGGTGGFVARHAACVVWLLKTMGQDASLTFVDPDRVEEGNIPRQNFCMAEIGRYKAETLATRFAQAFGMEIRIIPELFTSSMVKAEWDTLSILVGCVDSAAGRIQMEETLAENERWGSYPPRVCYLDAGNGRDFGQVLLGTTRRIDDLDKAFSLGPLPRCYRLPSPLLQQPGLRRAEPGEEVSAQTVSCAELLLANAQSLTINAAMADELADYLYRLLVTGDLKKFATFIDQPSGTKRSLYTSREALAQAIKRDPSFFLESQASAESVAELRA